MLKQEKLLKALVFILILVFYTSFLVYKIKVPAADDLPRQITIGQQVLQGNWDILYKNVFSYIEPDYTFFNHHWLSGVIFYILYGPLGWSGLSIFKILILLTAFTIIFKASLQKASFWLVAAVSVPAVLILRERTGLRPEVFSYLFIALFIYLLLHFEKYPEKRRIFWLIPLQLLWVNMHVFFSIGIMLVAGFLFEKIIVNWKNLKNNLVIRRLSVVFIAVVLVSFINPRFIGGVVYRYPNISLEISENQSISQFLTHAAPKQDISVYVFKPLALVMVLSIASFFFYYYKQRRRDPTNKEENVLTKNKIPIFYILAGLATTTLSFFILRALSFFGFMFLLVVPALLNSSYLYIKNKFYSINPRAGSIFGNVLVGLLIVAISYLIFTTNKGLYANYAERGLGAASMSEGGINFFKENNLKGPIFNDADIGSYLIHYLYPEEKVFSDNRFGDAYSPSFWDDIYIPMFIDESVWKEQSKKYNFNTIFLYQYDNGPGVRQFIYDRIRDPEWAFVYGDTFSIIFVRNTLENQHIIDKYRITPENAYQKLDFLINSKIEDDRIAAADIFNLLGRVDLSRNLFLDVVIKRPNNAKIWMIMGEWELSIDKPENSLLGMMYLEKAISLGQKTPEAYSFLGLAYFRLGKFEQSTKVLEKALEINPDRGDAKDLLLEINRILRLKSLNSE